MKVSYALLLLGCLVSGGCSLAQCKAVPVQRVPEWMLARPRALKEPINLLSLRADPPELYMLGPRDILGIFIPGALGDDKEQLPPTHFPEDSTMAPSMGYPIPVRDDGTLVLPMIDPIKVTGMTLTQVESEVRRRYIDSQIFANDNVKIVVTLMRKRTNQVLVVREDSGAAQPSAGGILVGPAKRGSVFAVDLPADESDVMHALAKSGGLPGLDAQNEVIILRGKFADATHRECLLQEMMRMNDYAGAQAWASPNADIVRIPLRAEPGMPQRKLSEDDIILKTGDVIFIETREREVFYTGGLLHGGEHPLPRDYDLDVLAAMSIAGHSAGTGVTSGSLGRGGFGGGGGGSSGIIPATQIIVVRRLPNGGTVPIRINLNTAIVNSSERILIQPGDYIMLQYTPAELAANIVLGNVSFNYFLNNINN
ncbi:MAG: polysaccharide biosynthesis/export family protein [Planctomycetaceae bacterium]|nr:polysaccharide biosynthesis/export family protein [Planctomycetaceae bacterium]